MLLDLGIAGSPGVGAVSLITSDQNYKTLENQIDKDLAALEKKISQPPDLLPRLTDISGLTHQE